jgi:hypothetical protein
MSYVQIAGWNYYPQSLGLDVKAEALKACKEHAGDNKIAQALCDCMRDLKADKEHFRKCSEAAARAAATAYCYGVSLCGDVAAEIAGPVANGVYDVGDALVTGIKDLFGGDETECGCATCYWGRCWSQLSEAQRVHFCTMPEHRGDWPSTAELIKAGTDCPGTLKREVAARLDAVARVNAAYTIWLRGMAKTLNDQLLPQLVRLGKPNMPFSPAYVDALLARHPVSPLDGGAITMIQIAAARASSAGAPSWWSERRSAAKGALAGYGWFRGTAWDSPINITGIQSDQYAVARADIWGKSLVFAERLVFADILTQISQAAASVDRKKLQDFTAMNAARQTEQQRAAITGTLVLLAGAVAAGIVITRRRKRT